jgi:trehalose 6-phosphate synthase
MRAVRLRPGGLPDHADLQHFAQYVQAEATAEPVGPNQFRAFNRTVHANAFPIGIDVAEFQRLGQAKEARDTYKAPRPSIRAAAC